MPGEAQAADIDPQHVVVTEPVRGSDIPVQLMYVETDRRRLRADRPAHATWAGAVSAGAVCVRQWRRRHGGGARVHPERELDAGGIPQGRLCGRMAALSRRGRLRLRQDRQARSKTSASGGSCSTAGRWNTRTSSRSSNTCKTLPFIDPDRDRLHGHEPRRRDGVQDRVRISRRARHDRERAGGARIPAASARRHRAHQSGDRAARRRAHADARAGEGARRASPRTSRGRACAPITTPIFVQGRNSRRAAGHLPRLLRPAHRARQGRALGDLRARRARLRLCATERGRRATSPTRCSGRRSRIRSRSSTSTLQGK